MKYFKTLFFLVLLSWTVTVLLAPLVGAISAAFGLGSETAIGNISAIFLILAGFVAFGWVILEDRLARRSLASRKLLLLLAAGIWIAGLLLTSLAQNYAQLLTYQVLTAIGYAAITPLAFSMAMDLTPPEDRTKTFGLLDIAALVGAGLGFLLAGMLVDFVPWNVPFLLIAGLGGAVALCLVRITDPKKGVQDQELGQVLTEGAEYSYHIDRTSLAQMVKRRSNLLLIAVNALLYLASGSITYYFIRMMVHDHGFASSIAVLFFLGTYCFQAIGCIFWTKRADRKFATAKSGKVKVLLLPLLIGLAFLMGAYALGFSVANGWDIGLFAGLLICGAFFLSSQIAISFSLLGEINLPETRATVFSLTTLAQTLGRGGGIFAVGLLFTWVGTYQWAFVVVCISYLVAAGVGIPLLTSVPRDLTAVSHILAERAEKLKVEDPISHLSILNAVHLPLILQSSVLYEDPVELVAERYILVNLLREAVRAKPDAVPIKRGSEQYFPLLYIANIISFILFTVFLFIYLL